ncbi:hypothetical protein Tco_1332271 [Tanacetum coccineum]
MTTNNTIVETDITKPLLLGSTKSQQDEQQDNDDPSDELSEEIREPVTSIMSAYRLLTPFVKVQLIIYFMLKYTMEILLAESSVITSYYFVWSTSNVALFLACLGLTVLPVSIFVGSYIRNVLKKVQKYKSFHTCKEITSVLQQESVALLLTPTIGSIRKGSAFGMSECDKGVE